VAPATAISPGPLSPAAPSLLSCGPTSGTTTILPRPKPGRKPASDEPENKRKAQNRAAQRAFRERKLQGQQQLEYENKDLKTANDAFAREIQALKDSVARGEAVQARLDADMSESVRRENELRAQHERDMNTLATFEQRTREAEHKTANYLNELHTLRAEVAILRAKVGRPLRHTDKREASVPPAHITNPVGGCDDCGKDGTCPCVDTYLEADDSATKTAGRHSMPIESMLSPHDSADPARMNSIPELISDHSSPEDMEIDFTHAFKATSDLRSLSKADKCGFCEDGGKCICAEAEAAMDLPLSQPMPAISLATKTPVKTTKPGTCAQCQADPAQKAYCESLARTRTDARPPPEGEPAAKRSRTSASASKRDLSVPCADAYELYKRYSSSRETPTYDDVYQDYVKTHPAQGSSRRARLNVESAGNEAKGRQRGFSAYETDIAAVIATLHQQPAGGNPTATRGAKGRRVPKT
jgi:hypothetical protein